ncbi:hypothetical protein CQA66_00050 [Helicobacter aurati]|uniref:CCA tRNA nucleotidyltransferase n=1 Tax=Helicobacter aurati TaxID=137778 RepID=A0A3D8J804_9HELI|nr:hypothetical protein [Helicobacter aurati]RDU73627.1 hypothetical protein CQA66_00050 [Helicobacter aurati]
MLLSSSVVIKLPSPVLGILQILDSHGFETCLVGGCVRDILSAILQKRSILPKDWDIATSATPNKVLEIFSRYDSYFKVIPIGIQHGTLRILPLLCENAQVIEITTYRIEGKYSDKRKPDSVFFTTDLRKDLARRDFRMNAIACSLKNHEIFALDNPQEYYHCAMQIRDYYGGIRSLQQRQIVCVGNPAQRFEEDALRIMRALRFSAVLEPHFCIEFHTQEALRMYKDNLCSIAKERIQSEYNAMLLGDYITDIALCYREVFAVIYPEILSLSSAQYQVNMSALQYAPFVLSVRLAIFFHSLSKEDVAAALKRMRYDKKTLSHTLALVALQQDSLPLTRMAIKEMLFRVGEVIFTQYIQVHIALAKAQNAEVLVQSLSEIETIYRDIIERRECFLLGDLTITGDDIVTMLREKQIFDKRQVGAVLQQVLYFAMSENLCCNVDSRSMLLMKAQGIVDSL